MFVLVIIWNVYVKEREMEKEKKVKTEKKNRGSVGGVDFGFG